MISNSSLNDVLRTMCFTCKKFGHDIKSCRLHKSLRTERRASAGNWAESFTSNVIPCPRCKDSMLLPVKGKLASLDLQCIKEGCKVEVKSRCLSNNKLPNYVKIHGGEYNNFCRRILEENLTLIIVIYRVDERNDQRIIRLMLSVDNSLLKKAVENGKNLELHSGLEGKDEVKVTDKTSKVVSTINEDLTIIRHQKKSLIIIPNIEKQTLTLKNFECNV